MVCTGSGWIMAAQQQQGSGTFGVVPVAAGLSIILGWRILGSIRIDDLHGEPMGLVEDTRYSLESMVLPIECYNTCSLRCSRLELAARSRSVGVQCHIGARWPLSDCHPRVVKQLDITRNTPMLYALQSPLLFPSLQVRWSFLSRSPSSHNCASLHVCTHSQSMGCLVDQDLSPFSHLTAHHLIAPSASPLSVT